MIPVLHGTYGLREDRIQRRIPHHAPPLEGLGQKLISSATSVPELLEAERRPGMKIITLSFNPYVTWGVVLLWLAMLAMLVPSGAQAQTEPSPDEAARIQAAREATKPVFDLER